VNAPQCYPIHTLPISLLQMLNSKNTPKFQISLQDTEIVLLQLQNDSVSCEDKNEPNVWYSGVCYNEQFYNVLILLRTVFINKIRMLQWTQILQQTWRN